MVVHMFSGYPAAYPFQQASVLFQRLYNLCQSLFALPMVMVLVCSDPPDDSAAYSHFVKDPFCIRCVLCVHLFSLCSPVQEIIIFEK